MGLSFKMKFPGISFLAFRWLKVYTHFNLTISGQKGVLRR